MLEHNIIQPSALIELHEERLSLISSPVVKILLEHNIIEPSALIKLNDERLRHVCNEDNEEVIKQ